jgi:hypothetical protein
MFMAGSNGAKLRTNAAMACLEAQYNGIGRSVICDAMEAM